VSPAAYLAVEELRNTEQPRARQLQRPGISPEGPANPRGPVPEQIVSEPGCCGLVVWRGLTGTTAGMGHQKETVVLDQLARRNLIVILGQGSRHQGGGEPSRRGDSCVAVGMVRERRPFHPEANQFSEHGESSRLRLQH
jgi:hypothetical protein